MRGEGTMNLHSDIRLVQIHRQDGYCEVKVNILGNKDLCFTYFANGSLAVELTGHKSFEHSITINSLFKDTLLLLMLKENFFGVSDFKTWLDRKNVCYVEDMWPREGAKNGE